MSHTTDNWKDEKKGAEGLLEGLHSAKNQDFHFLKQMCHQRQLTVCTVPPVKLGVVEQEQALIGICLSL